MDTIDALRLRLARVDRARQEAESKAWALYLANRALTERQERLEELVAARSAELEEARALVDHTNTTRTMFVATLSHELRTPLNAIIGYGEMLSEDLVALELEDLAHDAQRVLGAGNYLILLINDLLDLEKAESGELGIHLEEVDLAPLFREVAEIISADLEANRNHLEIEIADTASAVITDSTRLRQILHNLLSNACKFTHDGTIRIVVLAELRGESLYLIVEVIDTGIGIAAEDLPRIFSRFAQTNATHRRRFGGTGVGLVLTRRLCQRLGGDISVASKPGVGTRFRFWIPLDPALES